MPDAKETLLNEICPDWREAAREALKTGNLERFMAHARNCERCRKALQHLTDELIDKGVI